MSERVKPKWPENQWPTAAEWAEWFVSNPPAEREAIAARVLTASETSSRCFMANHEGALREVEVLRRQLWRYQMAWRSARRWRKAWRMYMAGEAT